MTAFEAVLFDCDGVLVDSEPITNGLLRDMLEELGWVLTPEECFRVFVGKAVRDERANIEAQSGRPLTEAWMADFYARRNAALNERLTAIEHIHEAVQRVHQHHGGRIACASGADRFKVELQLNKVGLASYFEGRVFSGHEMPRSKPAPDVYLAAAAALQADPRRCAVVEDTVTGVTAGVAAGATVFAYLPHGALHDTRADLLAAGASQVFGSMAELPALLGC
ncbi:HAD family phosphatase [Curvibacter sp. RS43]|uniref:HAD family phosphatase n=1 Tax=Curvibacter microcysteis TaxID=3026419 RepID=A0ABT5MMC3_9BURK|nr:MULTISPECIES: HAD family phosphatase [unclassified Curvibacter]MDD0810242.1 HAD family phosphatase [Curvibacter sp. RS43]MDD0817007.1 HAD family phosphatase [Curvibacter sp. HBC28]